MDEQRPWHRLFALSWIDFFRGQPVTVDPEKDLSLKKQLLDVLLLRKEGALLTCLLPDGFEELANYTLVSFKSHRDKLSAWALIELLSHYVNLRKQVSPSMDEADLLPEEEFRLIAVSIRYPQQLASSHVPLVRVKEGVYEVRHFTGSIRLVVINQLPLQEHNALLHLFSTKPELVTYGMHHYRIRSGETSTLLNELFRRYQKEVHTMPDALEEFTRETMERYFKELPLEKRLATLSLEERLHGLSVEERESLLRLLQAKQSPANPE